MLKKFLNRVEKLFVTSLPSEQKGVNPDFNPQVHAERVLKWQANNSDEKFRTDYPCLNADSILLDLGGYHGDFTFCMNAKYGATCHVFEVIPDLQNR